MCRELFGEDSQDFTPLKPKINKRNNIKIISNKKVKPGVVSKKRNVRTVIFPSTNIASIVLNTNPTEKQLEETETPDILMWNNEASTIRTHERAITPTFNTNDISGIIKKSLDQCTASPTANMPEQILLSNQPATANTEPQRPVTPTTNVSSLLLDQQRSDISAETAQDLSQHLETPIAEKHCASQPSPIMI